MTRDPPPHHRLASLDTLRGLAILAVVALHVSQAFKPVEWLGDAARTGKIGVQLFFLVSAITMSFMWRSREGEPQRVWRFYVRRFMRIAPLFWGAICFYLAWELTRESPRGPDVLGWRQVLLTASFLHGFSPSSINTVVPGGWSIAVEMTFYAVFPALASRLGTPLRALGFAFASYLVLGVVGATFVERTYHPPDLFIYYSMLTQFPVFPVGMFLYLVAMGGARPEIGRVAALVASWLLVAFAAKYLFHLEARPLFWLQIALIGSFVYLVIHRGWHLRLVSFVGTLSYSMYLFHFAVLDVFEWTVPAHLKNSTGTFLLVFVAVAACSVGIARVSSLTIERWSSRAARFVIGRTSPAARHRGEGDSASRSTPRLR